MSLTELSNNMYRDIQQNHEDQIKKAVISKGIDINDLNAIRSRCKMHSHNNLNIFLTGKSKSFEVLVDNKTALIVWSEYKGTSFNFTYEFL